MASADTAHACAADTAHACAVTGGYVSTWAKVLGQCRVLLGYRGRREIPAASTPMIEEEETQVAEVVKVCPLCQYAYAERAPRYVSTRMPSGLPAMAVRVCRECGP
eukprot:2245557-Rhodomonas_salina.1